MATRPGELIRSNDLPQFRMTETSPGILGERQDVMSPTRHVRGPSSPGTFTWPMVSVILRLIAFLAVLAPMARAQSDFTIIALPDTQYYSEDYPATFTAQTQWIVNNQSA